MHKITWQLEKRKLSALKPFPGNPRKLSQHDGQHLSISLETFRTAEPPVINTDNVIIGGHMRVKILKRMGVKEWECLVPSRTLTQNEVAELNIRLNRNAGEWDWDALANSDEWDVKDPIEWGFEPEELAIDTVGSEEESEDVDAIDAPAEPKTSVGDVYELDEHTLTCCDAELIQSSHDNALCLTDPPYDMCAEKLNRCINKFSCNDLLIISSFKQLTEFIALSNYKFHFDFVINCKIPKSFMNRKQPYYTHQNGVYMTRNGKTCFSNDNSKGRRSDDESNTGCWHTIIESPRNTSASHGHQKSPTGMCDVLAGFSFSAIADPFAGSGTSLICAAIYCVPFVGCEISPAYCDVIVTRYCDHVQKKGKTPDIRLNGECIDWESPRT